MLTKVRKQPLYYLYIGIFLFFLFIAFNTPFTHDDWYWGTDFGLNKLESGFKDYNGRYLGNLIIIILTRSTLLRVLFFGLISTILVILVAKLSGIKNQVLALSLSFTFYMLIPTRIYAQTFGYYSGFVNYVPSIALILLYLYIVKNIFSQEMPTYSKSTVFWAVPLGISTQLFVEHVTLLALFLGAFLILYTYVRFKKVFSIHISYFVSTIIGALIMFTNGAYLNVLRGEDSYRTVKESVGLFEQIHTTYRDVMYQILFLSNNVLHIFVSILIAILVFKTKTNRKWIERLWKPFSLLVVVGFALFSLRFEKSLGDSFLGVNTKEFEVILSLIFFIVCAITPILLVKSSQMKIKFTLYALSIVLLTIPFLFITPFGPRCIFATYTVMLVFALTIFGYLSKEYNWSTFSLRNGFVVISVVLMVVYIFLIGMNGYADRNRIARVKNQIDDGAKQVELIELPYPQYHWFSNPKPGLIQTDAFKMMYSIPKEIDFKIIPFFKSQR